jgi:RNA polymerase sigma-70 factor (ECF subfamily)
MTAIGEQTVRWFSAESAAAEPTETAGATETAEPDLTALVRDYSGLLYRVALSVLHNPAEAEDVVQDAFVRILQRRHSLRAILDLRPWLVRIAWNLALDRARRIRPAQIDDLFAASLVAADLPADRTLADAAQIRQVLRAMEHLPSKERQALLLSAMDELTTAEIAAVLNRSESSVRSLLFRARTRLRQRLEDRERIL